MVKQRKGQKEVPLGQIPEPVFNARHFCAAPRRSWHGVVSTQSQETPNFHTCLHCTNQSDTKDRKMVNHPLQNTVNGPEVAPSRQIQVLPAAVPQQPWPRL